MQYQALVNAIKASAEPATGCTEPVAIALNTATAWKNAKGVIKKVNICLDIGLFKNAMGVGIPGTKRRGIAVAAALGLAGGNCEDALNVLQGLSEECYNAAQKLEPLINITLKPDAGYLYIETILETDEDSVRVITCSTHTNIVLIEHTPFSVFKELPQGRGTDKDIQGLTLEYIKKFADEVEPEQLLFLQDCVDMNKRIAREGKKSSFGKALASLNKSGSALTYVPSITGSASYARMSGVPLPVMTATGSGNQGITLFLTVWAMAEQLGSTQIKALRALALAAAVNICVKHYIGALSPLCACGVASGMGASLGIVYLLGGEAPQLLAAMKNVLGSITGMLCDGAKEGCANKVALSSTCAVSAALLAMEESSISENDGILGDTMQNLLQNLEYLSKIGLKDTNRAILDIMLKKQNSKVGGLL